MFFVGYNFGTTAHQFFSQTKPASVTITHVTSNTVEGKFSGELEYSSDGNAIDTLLLTNGAFRLKY